MPQFDVVVVGLGAMGSAALYELARRGFRVAGIERFSIGHDHGSSHGETRIIRLGYFEHPSYVPLLRRTYELWRDLEAAAERRLMRIGGIVEIGPPDGTLVNGTLAASRLHELPHDVMDAAETMRRFPAFDLPPHFVGVFQPDGGYVAVERTIETLVAMATAAGAEVTTGVAARSVVPHGQGVRVVAGTGAIEARTAIVAAGAWVTDLLPGLRAPLRATREVMAWFAPLDPAPFARDRYPVFILESDHGMHYGFPMSRSGTLKIAKHHHRDETIFPNEPRRAAGAHDETLIRCAIAEHIPAANGPMIAAKTCIYTMAPDHHFVVDRLPETPNIVVASPCSGHGFKFAPVMGEILADLATDGATAHDIGRFRLARFGLVERI
jgi:sarcosine oxidase